MDLRRFLLTALAGTLTAPLAAEAQQAAKVPRIGYLTTNLAAGPLSKSAGPRASMELMDRQHGPMKTMTRGVAIGSILMMLASPLGAQDVRYQGRTVAEWIAQMRGQPSRSEQEAVVSALRHFGARAVPALVQMLRDRDADVRLGALWAFFMIGPAPREALPELVWIAAKDDNNDVRTMAAWVASSWLVGVPPSDSLPALVTAMQGPDAELRHKAAHWVVLAVKAHDKRIDPRLTGQVVPLLADVLREVDVELRREIIAALGAIGPPAKAAIPELRRLVRDDNEGRHQAQAALRSIEER